MTISSFQRNKSTYLRVTQRQKDLANALRLSSGECIAVQMNGRHTSSIRQNLNVLQGRCCSTRGDSERLEDSLFTNPPTSERCRGAGLCLAVRDLSVGEVAREEIEVR